MTERDYLVSKAKRKPLRAVAGHLKSKGPMVWVEGKLVPRPFSSIKADPRYANRGYRQVGSKKEGLL